MTKVLILSDSHGLEEEVSLIKERHQVDQMIHCGDSELEADHPALEGMIYAKGNCDYDARFTYDQTIVIAGVRFFITHGHMYDVHRGMMRLAYRAEEEQAQVVCFGHTHIAGAEKIDDQLFINPGSILLPRNNQVGSYVILDWKKVDKVKVLFYSYTGELINDLVYETSIGS